MDDNKARQRPHSRYKTWVQLKICSCVEITLLGAMLIVIILGTYMIDNYLGYLWKDRGNVLVSSLEACKASILSCTFSTSQLCDDPGVVSTSETLNGLLGNLKTG